MKIHLLFLAVFLIVTVSVCHATSRFFWFEVVNKHDASVVADGLLVDGTNYLVDGAANLTDNGG